MKREAGPDWEQAVEIDERIRKARPPFDLFLHRSCKPLPEAVQIPEDSGMTQPELWDAECDSGFCWL